MREFVRKVCLLSTKSGLMAIITLAYPTVATAISALVAACAATGFDKVPEVQPLPRRSPESHRLKRDSAPYRPFVGLASPLGVVMNFASDYTTRVRFKYSDTVVPGGPHKSIIRLGAISDVGIMASKWNVIASFILPGLLHSASITQVDYALVGSSVWIPLGGATIGAGSNASGGTSGYEAGRYMYMDMRSDGVSDAGPFYLFLAEQFTSNDGIIPASGWPGWLADLQTNIVAQGLTGIDRTPLISRNQTISGVNDEVMRKLRR